MPLAHLTTSLLVLASLTLPALAAEPTIVPGACTRAQLADAALQCQTVTETDASGAASATCRCAAPIEQKGAAAPSKSGIRHEYH